MWIKLTHQMSAIPLSVFWSQRRHRRFISALHTAGVLSVGDGKEGERDGKKRCVLGPGSALCGWALGDELGAVNAIRTSAPH